ncbi:hypothetical protein KY290_013425 [Solanum tuberosum]|uniref:Uncharacterized protein n=1 Tax=Solanum tuberosum TaxID=4113 RepID=A0ABQ7VLP6_SOLTU|nr:hypothetical protein KY285_012887 [Solanum tuberosum]KAH0769444.1 hypothetical protein KY290_013425 [Solanum tuberosum]
MVNFEFGLAILRAKVRAAVGMETPPYPMAGMREEESHNLHLSWSSETIQLKFGIEMLKDNTRTQEGIEEYMDDILCLCNQPKPIKIKEARINYMILELRKKS